MADPAVGFKDLLVAAGVGVFAAPNGWSIHIGKEPAEPDTAITIYHTQGLTPNPKWLVDYPSMQIRIRGKANGYQDAYSKTVEVRNALLGLPSQDLNGDRWVSVTMPSDFGLIGYDESSRPIFTGNFQLIIEPASGTHRVPL